ncbi:DUF7539 family protein [Salinigranum halophilum]|jgi:hypothetical protein|uniref:DUF7539 family protein n=1 Tax=Salinigranum halophilum TaxID=2565931 RepID=UPI0010A85A59|nr:hypothetical protein [Salinigranum halophilum]
MAEFPDERQLVLGARSQLDQWMRSARREAYADLFEGDDPLLSPEEVQLLDALDSELEREGGDGVWGTDRYGIHTAGTSSSDTSLGVVCVYHPQITKDSVLRGGDELDDETEERLNAALWQYSERVATLIEAELDEFVRRAEG